MKISDIHLRDPFILYDGGKYYLYGSRGTECWGKCTGLDVYLSDDLENWSEPCTVFTPPENFWSDMNFWAPEVHKYNNKYYMFVSFKSETAHRGTQILVSDSPDGDFIPNSEHPVTPKNWECLDGTFYTDKNGIPYMIFCREWTEVTVGEIYAIRLTYDLKQASDEPFFLFRASDSPITTPINDNGAYVTDGPFLLTATDGWLIMLWSSFIEGKYAVLKAVSKNGEINGKWQHSLKPLFETEGGHGMMFKAKDNSLCYVMHCPNQEGLERPMIIKNIENLLNSY